MICENIGVNDAGHLTFAGQDTIVLAQQYGTPAYLMDEDRIRYNCRLYTQAIAEAFGPGSSAHYASKAASFKQIYRIIAQEGMGVDLVSPGEIATAAAAGFPMEHGCFHGNNKTDWDITYAMDMGVGCFVADSITELEAIHAQASRRGRRQKVLLRLTPGIDPHTYEAVATGKVDSKFGVAIETGQADGFVKAALELSGVELLGYHCHVGSQVFDSEGSVYHDAADIMMAFAASMQEKYGFTMEVLDIGGGYGVRYTESDPYVDIPANLRALAAHLRGLAQKLGITMPKVWFEPGRSIVADAGMTLYTVGAVKNIPGYKNYASVDGGMSDNPRFALYGSAYTVLSAGKIGQTADERYDVVGRCCESGDVIQPDIALPQPQRGDILAVCTTGAYNYSMASNYNRIPRPPIVMLSGGESYVAVRRETLEDLLRCDL